MVVLRFASLAIRRSPLRSLLVVALIGVGLSFAVTSLALRVAASDRVDEIKTTVGTSAVITVNPDQRRAILQQEAANAQEEGRQVDFAVLQTQLQQLTDADLEVVAGLEYASLVDIGASIGASYASEELSAIADAAGGADQGGTTPGGAGGQGAGAGRFGGIAGLFGGGQSDVLLSGNISLDLHTSFTDGSNVLVEGRGYGVADFDAGANVVVVDQETAATLGLAIGDLIELESNARVVPPENTGSGGRTVALQVADESPERGATTVSFEAGAGVESLVPGMTLYAVVDDAEHPLILLDIDVEGGTLELEANDIEWATGTTLVNSYSESHDVTLEIIGIYASLAAPVQEGFFQAPPTWYVPLDSALALRPQADAEVLDSATFSYGSAEQSEQFVSDVAEILDPEAFVVTTDRQTFDDIESSVQRLSTTSTIGLVAGLSVVGVMMLLLMVLIVRSRVREVGILKAIGARDRTIVGQFGVEVVLLTAGAAVVAIVLTLGSGRLIADQFRSAAATTSSDVSTGDGLPAAQQVGQVGGGGGPGGGRLRGGALGRAGLLPTVAGGATEAEVTEVLDSVEVSLSPQVVGLSFAAALLIALVGVAVPTLTVARMRPAQVLRFE